MTIKKILSAGIVAMVALVLASCNKEEKKVMDFALDFASKVQTNDVRDIRRMYAAAELCDSFALDYQADSIRLEKEQDGYIVRFTDDRSMLVTLDDKGHMAVEASYGVFAFDPDLIGFALRTGWIDPYMDDATIAVCLKDHEFLDFITDRFTRELKQKVTASQTGFFGQSFADRSSLKSIVGGVRNRTDYDIPGEAYKVVYRAIYWAFPEDNQTSTFDGQDIPAGGSVGIRGTKRGVGEPTESSISVRFDEKLLPRLCLQLYKGNGHDYEDFKKMTNDK